jgi:hypothetical protein
MLCTYIRAPLPAQVLRRQKTKKKPRVRKLEINPFTGTFAGCLVILMQSTEQRHSLQNAGAGRQVEGASKKVRIFRKNSIVRKP